MNKTKKHETNTFYYYAEQYRKSITDEEEIEKIDMTDVFYQELDTMIDRGEIIILNVNAKVRLGKSTEAIALGKSIFELLQKHKFKKKSDVFSMRNIARDQSERQKMMMNPKYNQTVMVIDEDNELEKGGENSSANDATLQDMSNIQAGRYVHCVYCSPKSVADPNADLLLSIISIDKESKTTRNKLYYRYSQGTQDFIQLLGFVDVYVGDLINNWETNVKKPFFRIQNKPVPKDYKLLHNDEDYKKDVKQFVKDKAIVEKAMAEDFFVEYTVKKYEKMEIMTKEGIFRPRLLEVAEVVLDVVSEMEPLCRLQHAIKKDIIKNFVKMEMRKHKIVNSIVGLQLATDEASGILDLCKSYFQIHKDLKAIENGIAKGKLCANDEVKEEIASLDTMAKKLKKTIDAQIQELEHYKEIQDKYNAHLKEKDGNK